MVCGFAVQAYLFDAFDATQLTQKPLFLWPKSDLRGQGTCLLKSVPVLPAD